MFVIRIKASKPGVIFKQKFLAQGCSFLYLSSRLDLDSNIRENSNFLTESMLKICVFLFDEETSHILLINPVKV